LWLQGAEPDDLIKSEWFPTLEDAKAELARSEAETTVARATRGKCKIFDFSADDDFN
jgi:hypothetical protein